MSEHFEIRRILVLNAVDTGIFSVLKVIPEHIVNLDPISERVTEITIENCDGTTKVKVSHSEQELKSLIEDCIRQDGISDASQS